MWNYNLDEMPKDGTEIVVMCETAVGDPFVRLIQYQNGKWVTVETVRKVFYLTYAIKGWAIAPKEYEEKPEDKIVDWFEHVYPLIAKDYEIPYWEGLIAIKNMIDFKLSEGYYRSVNDSITPIPDVITKCKICEQQIKDRYTGICLTCGKHWRLADE